MPADLRYMRWFVSTIRADLHFLRGFVGTITADLRCAWGSVGIPGEGVGAMLADLH